MRPRLSSIIAQLKKVKNSLQAAEKSAAYFFCGVLLVCEMSGTKKRKKQLVLTLSISRRIDCLLNANEELSYRVPKRVRKCILLNDSLYAVCPRCGVSIERDYVAYCSRCGQMLNWVGYELRAWRKIRQKRR